MRTIFKHKYDIKRFLNGMTFKYESQSNTKFFKICNVINYETSKIQNTIKYETTQHKATFNMTRHQTTFSTRDILNTKN